MKNKILFVTIALALCMIAMAGCATPVPTQPPVVQTVLVPQTIIVTPINTEPRMTETRIVATRAAEPTSTNTPSPTIAPKPVATNTILRPTSVSITLGTPRQLMHWNQPDALGMAGVPDQPLTPILQPDKSYRLFISGGDIGGVSGGPGLISTKDFLTYAPVVGNGNKAQTVFAPSCRGNTASAACVDNYDAHYAGVDLVFPASNGKDLLMIYQGVNKNFATQVDAFYSVVALASSTDNGVTWTRRGQIITGTDPKPTNPTRTGANGADQSGAIIANGYIYDFYPYFPSNSNEDSTIQAARAPVASDGAPGTWTKYYNGSFGSQPGLGGLGSQIIPSASACKRRPAQPWLTFSTYLNEYVIVFVCEQGWFFSTSADLVNWSVPAQFYTSPEPMFTGQTDENVSLVTPGNPGQVIGQTGYVLYASTPAWGKTAHMLYMRSFTFNK